MNLGPWGGSCNSWDLEDSWSSADLVSTSTSDIKGPRTADGSIPAAEFLRPRDQVDLGADFSDHNGAD